MEESLRIPKANSRSGWFQDCEQTVLVYKNIETLFT
jgi:hypothetical protein